jgi:hypothetical protein
MELTTEHIQRKSSYSKIKKEGAHEGFRVRNDLDLFGSGITSLGSLTRVGTVLCLTECRELRSLGSLESVGTHIMIPGCINLSPYALLNSRLSQNNCHCGITDWESKEYRLPNLLDQIRVYSHEIDRMDLEDLPREATAADCLWKRMMAMEKLK